MRMQNMYRAHNALIAADFPECRTVLQRLSDAGLIVNKEKSCFRVERLQYMGIVLTKGGIEPNPEMVEKVCAFDKPESAKDVKSFLGLVNISG